MKVYGIFKQQECYFVKFVTLSSIWWFSKNHFYINKYKTTDVLNFNKEITILGSWHLCLKKKSELQSTCWTTFQCKTQTRPIWNSAKNLFLEVIINGLKKEEEYKRKTSNFLYFVKKFGFCEVPNSDAESRVEQGM